MSTTIKDTCDDIIHAQHVVGTRCDQFSLAGIRLDEQHYSDIQSFQLRTALLGLHKALHGRVLVVNETVQQLPCAMTSNSIMQIS